MTAMTHFYRHSEIEALDPELWEAPWSLSEAELRFHSEAPWFPGRLNPPQEIDE
jgi:hypothetical protein